jgi:predicted RNA-binding Zn-ribbon protein involved in translation (DUF1610 family)
MELKCTSCKRVWDYTGKNKVYATCPDCRKIVKIKGDKNE